MLSDYVVVTVIAGIQGACLIERIGYDKHIRLINTRKLALEAACKVRGPVDAPKFEDYILPLIFLKRLADVFEDKVNHLGETFGGVDTAWKLVEDAHRRGQPLVRFYLPANTRWNAIQQETTGLGELPTWFGP